MASPTKDPLSTATTERAVPTTATATVTAVATAQGTEAATAAAGSVVVQPTPMVALPPTSVAATVQQSAEHVATVDLDLDFDIDSFESFIERDVTAIAQQFKNAYQDLMRATTRPNVLVCGCTGAGKSSLINSVFGMQLAQEGAGEPITTHFTRYAPEDATVVIYDSRGLEHGNTDAFMESTRKFFDSLSGNIVDSIHVVWYVINGAGSRIQPFEEEICRTLFANVPLMFLINKADISNDEDRAILRQTLTALNLPSCVGIFDTVSGSGHTPLLNVTKCPKCGSDDLNIRKKKGIATCEACEVTISLLLTKDDIITRTLDTLPVLAREAFIAAQTFSCMHKETRAKVIIKEFYNECTEIRYAKSLLKGIAKMLVRLAMLWDFREHGKTLGAEIAQDLLRRELSFRDKLLFFLRKCKGERYRTTAMGVLWNRCLRRVFILTFISCAEEQPQSGAGDAAGARAPDWHDVVQSSFQDLADGELTKVEDQLKRMSLEEVLEAEMPAATSAVTMSTSARRHDVSPPISAIECADTGAFSVSTPLPSSPPVQQQASVAPATVAAATTAMPTAVQARPHTPVPLPKSPTPPLGRSQTRVVAQQPQLHHEGPAEEQSWQPPPRELHSGSATATAATAASTTPGTASTTVTDWKKEKVSGLRLDADDLAEIEQAAMIESELNQLDHASELQQMAKRNSLPSGAELTDESPPAGMPSVLSQSLRSMPAPLQMEIVAGRKSMDGGRPQYVISPRKMPDGVPTVSPRPNTTVPVLITRTSSTDSISLAALKQQQQQQQPFHQTLVDNVPAPTPITAQMATSVPAVSMVQSFPTIRDQSMPIPIPAPTSGTPSAPSAAQLSRSPRYHGDEGAVSLLGFSPATIPKF